MLYRSPDNRQSKLGVGSTSNHFDKNLETLVGKPKIHEHYYFRLGRYKVDDACLCGSYSSGETLEFNARFDDAFWVV